MTNLDPTNFSLLQAEFQDILTMIEDRDSTGLASSLTANRQTLVMIDGSKLYVTEILKKAGGKQLIDYYYYDWFSSDGQPKMKFHSERHDDTAYQTATEPFHIHAKSIWGDGWERLPNAYHQDLKSILEAFRIHFRISIVRQ